MSTAPEDRPTPLIGSPDTPTGEIVEPQEGPVVLVSSVDVGGLRRLSVRLHRRAPVCLVRDPASLWREVRRYRNPVLLVDACAPAIDPIDVSKRLGAMADRCTVVVWGATRKLREELAKRDNTHRWVHIELDTTPKQLAELLGSLL